MKKSEYLATNDVHEFVAWMSAHLDDVTFAHACIVRKGNEPWACTSLFNAYQNYRWAHVPLPEYGLDAGSDFASNVSVLERLQKALRTGLAAGDTGGVLAAATAVMKWGGVVNHNVGWLNTWRADLCRIIGETRDAINAGDTDHPAFARSELRFTSGMSKVYSLVCDDFAIYDSRVAAALCRAVVLFCRQTGRNRVPAALNFPWAAAKSASNSGNPPARNAAQDGYTFQRLVRGHSYVTWNMKASWLLAAVASHRSTQDSAFARLDSRAQRLRAMEAALFMFGYDLVNGPERGQSGGPRPPSPVMSGGPSPDTGPTTEDDWAQCKTPSRENPFEYRLAPAADGIQTRDVGNNPIAGFTDEEINRTLQALLRDFGDQPFPLANSVDRVPAGTERNGLGTAFWKETKRSAGYTSRPDFRGDDGFWHAYPALRHHGFSFEDIANPAVFSSDPHLAWGFYGHRLKLYRATQPHAGFHLLLNWASRMEHGAFVFTSNVDGQFQKAGFSGERVEECHGTIHALQCVDACTNDTWPADDFDPVVDPRTCRLQNALPRCPHCGSLARPNILMFGDWKWVDRAAQRQASRLASWLHEVNHLIVLEMGAGRALPTVRRFSERHGPRVVRINPKESAIPPALGIGVDEGALATLQALETLLSAG